MSVPSPTLRWIIAGGVLVALWAVGAEGAVVASRMDDRWVQTWLTEQLAGRES